MGLSVPEQPVLGGELLGQLGLEPVELAAELAILICAHRNSRRASSTVRVTSSRSGRVCLLVRSISAWDAAINCSASDCDSSEDLNYASFRTKSFSKCSSVSACSIARKLAGRTTRNRSTACRRQLSRPKLVGRLLRLAFNLPRSCLRFGLPD